MRWEKLSGLVVYVAQNIYVRSSAIKDILPSSLPLLSAWPAHVFPFSAGGRRGWSYAFIVEMGVDVHVFHQLGALRALHHADWEDRMSASIMVGAQNTPLTFIGLGIAVYDDSVIGVIRGS